MVKDRGLGFWPISLLDHCVTQPDKNQCWAYIFNHARPFKTSMGISNSMKQQIKTGMQKVRGVNICLDTLQSTDCLRGGKLQYERQAHMMFCKIKITVKHINLNLFYRYPTKPDKSLHHRLLMVICSDLKPLLCKHVFSCIWSEVCCANKSDWFSRGNGKHEKTNLEHSCEAVGHMRDQQQEPQLAQQNKTPINYTLFKSALPYLRQPEDR